MAVNVAVGAVLAAVVTEITALTEIMDSPSDCVCDCYSGYCLCCGYGWGYDCRLLWLWLWL